MKRKIKKGDLLEIQGKRWFDKVYGNTYFSCRIVLNDEIIKVIPFQYGYGDFYLQAAMQWLNENGYTNTRSVYELKEKQGVHVVYHVNDGLKKQLDHEDFTAIKVKFVINDGEILAVFPDEIFNHDGLLTCYAHIGQHSGCDKSFFRKRKATKEQYEPLLKELKRIGYDNLKVLN